jgi:hypothetical protein
MQLSLAWYCHLVGVPLKTENKEAAKNSQQLVLYNLQLEITLIYMYFTCIICKSRISKQFSMA